MNRRTFMKEHVKQQQYFIEEMKRKTTCWDRLPEEVKRYITENCINMDEQETTYSGNTCSESH